MSTPKHHETSLIPLHISKYILCKQMDKHIGYSLSSPSCLPGRRPGKDLSCQNNRWHLRHCRDNRRWSFQRRPLLPQVRYRASGLACSATSVSGEFVLLVGSAPRWRRFRCSLCGTDVDDLRCQQRCLPTHDDEVDSRRYVALSTAWPGESNVSCCGIAASDNSPAHVHKLDAPAGNPTREVREHRGGAE